MTAERVAPFVELTLRRTKVCAGLEYRGSSGVTRPCVAAVANYLQERRAVGMALLLSGPQDRYGCRSHAFLMTVEGSPELIVGDGFSSGYGGEGPRGLSTAIALLDTCGWDIKEVILSEKVFERVSTGQASWQEVQRILKLRKKPISYVYDYVDEEMIKRDSMSAMWARQAVNLPYALFDVRLLKTAIAFWTDPDAQLTKAYRRLEDAVRKRCRITGAKDFGVKLFARAFGHDKSPLVWRIDDEDTTCYAPLFAGAFAGFRNARAHRDPGSESDHELAMELLQLNTLFVLESRLVERTSVDDVVKSTAD